MEIIDENRNNPDSNQDKNTNSTSSTPEYNKWEEHHERNKLLAGVFVVGIGCLLFAREMGLYIPHWIFSWPMLLIAIGVYSGVKNQFQNATWFILILIGSAFLVRRFLPEFNLAHYTWPVIIIIIGIFIMTKPGNAFRSKRRRFYRGNLGSTYQWEQGTTGEEHIDSSAVFGSVKKNIVSKNFKGGEVNAVFGSAEVNLTQADITGTVQLEVNAVFGGMRLIVPAHWEIKSELTAVLGSVEDKRPSARNLSTDAAKTLILNGTAVLGGIEIVSY